MKVKQVRDHKGIIMMTSELLDDITFSAWNEMFRDVIITEAHSTFRGDTMVYKCVSKHFDPIVEGTNLPYYTPEFTRSSKGTPSFHGWKKGHLSGPGFWGDFVRDAFEAADRYRSQRDLHRKDNDDD